jgi:hypothetical protein
MAEKKKGRTKRPKFREEKPEGLAADTGVNRSPAAHLF